VNRGCEIIEDAAKEVNRYPYLFGTHEKTMDEQNVCLQLFTGIE